MIAICEFMFGALRRLWRACRNPVTTTRPDEDEVGERVEESAGHRGGVLREVHPEEVLRVRQPELREVALLQVEHALGPGAERGVEVRRLRDVLVRLAHHPEQREEHRHLDQEGKTTRQRVDLVLLVELHHLFVELGAVVLVLRLELLDLRLRPLHRHHRLGLLGREREHHQHHEDREQDDRDPEVRDDAVEERQDRPEEVVDGVEDGAGGEDHRISLLPPRRPARSMTNVRSVEGRGRGRPRATGGNARPAGSRARCLDRHRGS